MGTVGTNDRVPPPGEGDSPGGRVELQSLAVSLPVEIFSSMPVLEETEFGASTWYSPQIQTNETKDGTE